MSRAGFALRCAFALVLFACAAELRAGAAEFPYRGVAYVSFQGDEYLKPDSEQALTELGATGANWVSILATWYQPLLSSNTIAPDSFKSPTDDAVRKAIADAHARGLNVMLKPHVDVSTGDFRGNIQPGNTAAWFDSYRVFITHYAQLAQETGAELFCVGCELKSLSGAVHRTQWENTIAAVRTKYSGPLTYAALAVFENDEYQTVSFWPQLDLAGLDVYVQLTGSSTPTLEQLKAAWRSTLGGFDAVAKFTQFAAAVGRPVLFTEIGYQSSNGTNTTPFGVAVRALDQQEQADCYTAALEVFTAQSWLQGMFFWGWEAQPIDSATDSHYSARGKPAGAVLAAFYTQTNRAPILFSGPLVAPLLTTINTPVSAQVLGADADGDPLSVVWDFGNGLTDSAFSTQTVYSVPGTYTVTVTLSDGRGGSVSAQRVVEVFAQLGELAVERLTVRLNFARAEQDRLTLRCRVPEAAGVRPGGSVTLDAGGAVFLLSLDARGRFRSADRLIRAVLDRVPRNAARRLQLDVRRAALAATLADEGLLPLDAQNTSLTVGVSLNAPGGLFTQNAALLYSARSGKQGVAR